MLKSFLAALLLVGVCSAASFNIPEDEYNDLVNLIFGEPPSVNRETRVKRAADIEWENSVCECVPYYQCNYNGSMNDNGLGIIDIRLGLVGTEENPTSHRRPCDHYLSVCCLPPELIPGHDNHGNNNPGQGGNNNPGQGGNNNPGQGGNNNPGQGGNNNPGQGGNENPGNCESGNCGGGNNNPGQGGNENPGNCESGQCEGGNNNPGQGGNNNPGEGGNNNPGSGGGIGKPHVNKGCGYRNPDGIGFRITGNFNNEANFAEFPWMVAVLKQTVIQGNPAKVYQCGGSLIHRRVVLTAAHCVHQESAAQLTIRAGEWDTQTVSEPLPHQDRQVSVVATHPEYQKGVLYNDYALLILTQPVELADNVEVVCLPEPNDVFDYSKCFATGWGKNQFGDEGRYQVILKSIELPTVPHGQCQNSLRTTRLGKYFNLHKSFMCAGGINGLDTCTGDGGSPLVCPLRQDPSRYTQAGIVAWGIGCGDNGIPGVYADVTKGRRWIDQVLTSYKIDDFSYIPRSN